MASGSYFRFNDDDDKITYTYYHNHHEKNWLAEYTRYLYIFIIDVY